MQASRKELALWQEALAAGAQATDGMCPSAEEIWQASVGEASPSRVRELVDHTLSCSACSMAWRLAQELGADSVGREIPTAQPRSWRGWRSALAAIAACVILAVGLVWQESGGRSNLRSGETTQITSRLSDSELPREAFILRWSGPQAELRYDLQVTREDLAPVATAQGLSSATNEVEFQVAAEQLAAVPPGGKILWRVETILPSGVQLASETFVVQVK